MYNVFTSELKFQRKSVIIYSREELDTNQTLNLLIWKFMQKKKRESSVQVDGAQR